MQVVADYPLHLVDTPLERSSIPEELIGATYQFTDQKDNAVVFAIKMTQAKDPKEKGKCALWFGPRQHHEVKKRVESVLNFLEQNDLFIKFSGL